MVASISALFDPDKLGCVRSNVFGLVFNILEFNKNVVFVTGVCTTNDGPCPAMLGFSKIVCILPPAGLVFNRNVVFGCMFVLGFIRNCGALAVAVVRVDWLRTKGAATVVGLVAFSMNGAVAAVFVKPGSIKLEMLPVSCGPRP